MKHITIALLSGLALAAPAQAKSIAASPAGGGCTMKEQASLNISFNMQAKTLAEAKTQYDEKMKQLQNFAKQQELEKFEPQSMNYNIYAQNNGYNNMDKSYQLTGNVSYQLDSTAAAFKFAEFLEKEKFTVNLNVNSYRQGNCNP